MLFIPSLLFSLLMYTDFVISIQCFTIGIFLQVGTSAITTPTGFGILDISIKLSSIVERLITNSTGSFGTLSSHKIFSLIFTKSRDLVA